MTFRRSSHRHALLQALYFVGVITSGFMMYTGLGLICNTESPVVGVLSGSMEPAFFRGDILFLTNFAHEPYFTGDVLVYKVPGVGTPIVHRVIETHGTAPSGQNGSSKPGFLGFVPTQDQLMLTKGDNNLLNDLDLYRGLDWLRRRHIIGKVRGFFTICWISYDYYGQINFPLNSDLVS
jgi:signal peptidase